MLRWLPKPLQRFSLRSLFVAMTVIGIIAGLAGIHFRNRAHLRSIHQLVAAANGRAFLFEHHRGLLDLDSGLTVNVELKLNSISPNGFDSLQQAAALIDSRQGQRFAVLSIERGRGGKVNLERTKDIIKSFAPQHVHFYPMPSDEAAILLHRCRCQSIFLRQEQAWSSTTSMDLNCESLSFNGVGFAEFWRCVTPQSSVSKIKVVSSSMQQLLTVYPVPSLKEVEIQTQHVDECDVCQLMSRLHGVFVHLRCCGLNVEQQTLLHEAFAPNLMLDVHTCECNLCLDPPGSQ